MCETVFIFRRYASIYGKLMHEDDNIRQLNLQKVLLENGPCRKSACMAMQTSDKGSSIGLGGQGPGSIGLREMAACRRKAGWPVLALGLLFTSVSESC